MHHTGPIATNPAAINPSAINPSAANRNAANRNAADYFLDRHIREENGHRTAFIDPTTTLTYQNLHHQSVTFAAALARAGIVREQRIALVMLDTAAFPIAFWGAIRAGIVPVPMNTVLPADMIAYMLDDSRAPLLVVSADLLPALQPMLAHRPWLRHVIVAGPGADTVAGPGANIVDGSPTQGATTLADFLATSDPRPAPPVPTSADEVAFWLYSSGSTGAPKGTRHVHASLRATADTYGAQILGIQPDDLVFSAAKLFFAYGLGNAMTFPMSVAAAAILLPERPTPAAILDLMRTHRPTIFGGVPTLYASLLAHPDIGPGAGSSRLRRCISAGEALPEQLGTNWAQTTGVDILDGIGSTEMLHIYLSNRDGALQYGTSGQPVPGYDVKILADDGTDATGDEPGELVVRGPSAADGYWNQRDKSRRTFRGEWTHTGDKYIRQPDGYFRYCGRTDDMFKVSGIWVSPFEVEGALAAHPAVLEAAVVGHDDADGLTKPRAFVVLRPGFDDTPTLRETLKQHVKDRAGPWKYPRWIEFVPDLPKTATGKIQRYKLRAGEWA